jgi:DNA-binding cell septation regulator SpoVG
MKIKNMRRVSLGKTVAFFSVEWEGQMVINDMKLIQGANGVFAATPSRKYLDKKTNTEKWTPIVFFELDLLEKVTKAAQAEYGGEMPSDDIPF